MIALGLAHLGIVNFGVFCAAVVLLNLTPGPDTAYIVGQSIAHGRRAGLLSALGISAGCCVHTLASAFGLTALLAASASAFLIIKLAGAAYLIFLGLRMIVSTLRRLGDSRSLDHATQEDASAPIAAIPRSRRRIFAQGFLTNVLNPKVALFFLSFFPQFVAVDSPDKPVAFLVLGATMIVISTLYNSGMAWIAGGITRRMRGAPRAKVWLERTVGAAFIALGARLVSGGR